MATRKKHRQPKRRNAAAAALASPRFRLRRVESRKDKRGYSRKRTKQTHRDDLDTGD